MQFRPLYFIISIMGIGCFNSSAQDTYLKCDFEEGIPSDFILRDGDRNMPSSEMMSLGFDIDIPWISLTTDKESNHAACSTSWYKTSASSDDWMITPPVEIRSNNSILSWRSKAGDKEYRDGYVVYVSTEGEEPSDFNLSEPLFITSKEENIWTKHEISLNQYMGKTIRLAFVNNSTDKSTLYVDDIFIGVPASLEMNVGLGRTIQTEGEFSITGKIKNISDKPVSSYTIELIVDDGESIIKEYTQSLLPGESSDFEMKSDRNITLYETLKYKLIVKTGKDVVDYNGKVSCYPRRVVAEEITGTWCQYCVAGIYAFEEMHKLYPESFIGIAVHGSDPMEYSPYKSFLSSTYSMNEYPTAIVNRRNSMKGHPIGIFDYYNEVTGTPLRFGIDLNIKYDSLLEKIVAESHLYPVEDIENEDIRLSYVILENDVHKADDSRYAQHNAYSGQPEGTLGGFENLPKVIGSEQMYYQDVARYVSDEDFNGIAGSVPVSLQEGVPVSHEYECKIPDSVIDAKNVAVAVFVINAKSGEILNAAVTELDKTNTIYNTSYNSTPRVSYIDGKIQIKSDVDINSIEVFSTDGRCVLTTDLTGGLSEVPVTLSQGFYILRIGMAHGQTISSKIKI